MRKRRNENLILLRNYIAVTCHLLSRFFSNVEISTLVSNCSKTVAFSCDANSQLTSNGIMIYVPFPSKSIVTPNIRRDIPYFVNDI